MSREDGGAAFPTLHRDEVQKYGAPSRTVEWVEGGMTLRDYFAAKALTGLLGSTNPDHALPTWEAYAACAYGHADAMLAERAK